MSTRPKRFALAVAAGLLVLMVGLLASPALAVGWGPGNAYYNGIRRATGYGDLSNDRNAYAANKITYRDTYADGNTVYATVTWAYYEYSQTCGTQGGVCWVYDSVDSTPEIGTAQGTTTVWERDNLHGDADKVRGGSKVCVQLGFPVPDRCSETFYPSFSY